MFAPVSKRCLGMAKLKLYWGTHTFAFWYASLEKLRPGYLDEELTLPADKRAFERFYSLWKASQSAGAREYSTYLGTVSAEQFAAAVEKVKGARTQLGCPVPWKHLGIAAAVLGVPAEALVDEEIYLAGWPRQRVAAQQAPRVPGYRILFELQRRGMTVEEFLWKPSAAVRGEDLTRESAEKGWRAVWYAVFTGNLFCPVRITIERCRASKRERVSPALQLLALLHGHEVLGRAFWRLLTTPAREALPPGALGEVVGSLVGLGKREAAFLAGVARLLAGRDLGGEELRRGIEALLGWYLAEEK